MRKLFSLQYHAVCFMLEYLFLQGTTPLTLGTFESVSEAKCEYDDANLIWRNTPAYSLNDVKAMAWYSGKDSLIATWLEGKGFTEYSPYVGRLMQIGETGIKLKTANRSDSGSYWLSLTLASTDHKLEAVTHLEVIVAPSSQCKPNITEEGSILKAQLPFEGCGTPPLSPKWKNTSKTVIQESHTSSLLDLGRNSESGEYVVCSEGYSVMCYHGNISDLCTGLTKLQHERSENGMTSDPVSIILPIVLVTLIATAISILGVIWWKRKLSRGKRQSEQISLTTEDRPTDNAEACLQSEEYPLIDKGDTSMEGFPEIRNYLRGLYKDMTSVSLSPTGNESFVDVSEVYVDLDFQPKETRDFKYTETELARIPTYTTSVLRQDIHSVKAHNQNVSPIIIVGCSGSGKSTWCKHLVHCWSESFKNEDANVQDINLPNLGECQILLYLPLKSSDRGLSFQDLLKNCLFQEQPQYLNIITKYIHDKSHAKCILILIDGFDKIGENVKPISDLLDHKLISDLLDHKLFSSCTVIVTCRPSSLKLIFNACVDGSIQFKLYKVCELPPEKSTTYASKVLRRLNQHNKDCNIKPFLTFARNLHVQSLLQLPYLCLTLLFVWMENKNPYVEITDILLRIVEHLLDTAKTDQRCKEKILKLSQRNSPEVHTSVNKLDERFVKIKDLMYELSMTTEEIFMCETKRLADEQRLFCEKSAEGKDTLPLEVLHEIGLIYESLPLKSEESLSTLTFTNKLIYQFYVSMAIAFKKGDAFEYIVSDLEEALKHSMIIHMLWQFSPTLGKEIFVEISRLKTKNLENLGLSGQNNKCRYSVTKQSKKRKYHPVKWLELLMYKGDLDDEKLLFLTNALRSMDSLTSLVLENDENNDDLVFWLPCSQTLKKLVLNIRNCTLLLCPEWNRQIPVKLKEVDIKSVIINICDVQVLLRACKCIEKKDISPREVTTGDNETLP